MAWNQFNIRMPQKYIDYVNKICKSQEFTQSFFVQQLIYGSGNPQLPEPKRFESSKPTYAAQEEEGEE